MDTVAGLAVLEARAFPGALLAIVTVKLVTGRHQHELSALRPARDLPLPKTGRPLELDLATTTIPRGAMIKCLSNGPSSF